MSKKLFVVGTKTDVGKTFITGLIVKTLHESGEKVAYYKAAMSGNYRAKNKSIVPADALHVKTVSKISQKIEQMCPFVYESAVSPHLAAKIEGNPVEMSVLQKELDDLERQYDYITLEGSGGIICPLRFDEKKIFLEDVIKQINAPCILIADARLGTINFVGLTAAYIKALNIPLKGIILNYFEPQDQMQQDNLKMCEYITGVPVIACVQEGDLKLQVSAKQLTELYE